MKAKFLNVTIWLLYFRFLTIMISCNDDQTLPAPEFTLQEQYTVKRCEILNIKPQVESAEGTTFEWKLTETPSKSVDSVLSQTQNLDFITVEPGTYVLQLTAQKNNKEKIAECTITVENATYSEKIHKIAEYRPSVIGGGCDWSVQLSNDATIYPYQEHLEKLTQQHLSNSNEGISVGSWGGSVVFSFDHTIVNIPDSADFQVHCDYPNTQPLSIVSVAYDKNKNGKPDEDEWFEIKGEHFSTESEIKDYEVTVTSAQVNYDEDWGEYFLISYDWKDNKGKAETYEMQDFCPTGDPLGFGFFPGFTSKDAGEKLLDGWEFPMPLKGKIVTPQKSNARYVPQTENFDIAWAVDKSGKEAFLPGIDFIKIQNVEFDLSLEAKRLRDFFVYDLHLKEKEDKK